MTTENIFSNIPNTIPDEIFDRIIQKKSLTIERIVSKGHASQKSFWYDQEMNEWVIVLKGHTRLRIAENNEVLEMKTGDYVNIPAHCKHRVEWTDANEETIWLAVHYW
jgi:cupin 2 domain-containing protein